MFPASINERTEAEVNVKEVREVKKVVKKEEEAVNKMKASGMTYAVN